MYLRKSITSLLKNSLSLHSSSPAAATPLQSTAGDRPTGAASPQLATLDLSSNINEVLFFPDPDATQGQFDRFLQYLRSPTKTADGQINADQLTPQGVSVRVLTEFSTIKDQGSDVMSFVNVGIPVRFDDSPFLMHHKFALLDGRMLLNGSFNWTRAASEGNQENVVITSNSVLVHAFQQQFTKMWANGKELRR